MEDRAIRALEHIGEELMALRMALLSFAPEIDPADPGCLHPEDQRIDLSTMGIVEWQCGVCAFHFVSPLVEAR